MERWVVEKVRDARETERHAQDSAEMKRFVLHRHHDDRGEHLDLRLEYGHVLVGWRMPSDALDRLGRGENVVCELKRLHPQRWLDVNDAGCVVEDAGSYRWLVSATDGGVALFDATRFSGTFRFSRQKNRPEQAPDAYEKSVCLMKKELGLDIARAEDVAQLLAVARDGETARKRAIERLCALGKELDGDSFDEHTWRATLCPLSLSQIHAHLRSFERRFDEKYPPMLVTKQETLDPGGDKHREKLAAGILSEEILLP